MSKALAKNEADDERCPIRGVLDRIGDQWSYLVLSSLADGTLRFNELKRQIGDISQHMLARTLKKLEQDGLVTRTLFPVIPPRVDYTLTPLGHSLLVPMRGLVAWADENHAAIRAARRQRAIGAA
jgi:DNA-binding HxlR family transcriptional regulator